MSDEMNALIQNVVNDINVELNRSTIRLLISDIIDIYTGRYHAYEFYKEMILRENKLYSSLQNMDFNNHKTTFTFYPKHTILDEFAFNAIINERLNRKE